MALENTGSLSRSGNAITSRNLSASLELGLRDRRVERVVLGEAGISDTGKQGRQEEKLESEQPGVL